jgi:hypothetical protein
MGNVMPCEWRIWNDVVAFQDVTSHSLFFTELCAGATFCVSFHAGSSCALQNHTGLFPFRYIIFDPSKDKISRKFLYFVSTTDLHRFAIFKPPNRVPYHFVPKRQRMQKFGGEKIVWNWQGKPIILQTLACRRYIFLVKWMKRLLVGMLVRVYSNRIVGMKNVITSYSLAFQILIRDLPEKMFIRSTKLICHTPVYLDISSASRFLSYWSSLKLHCMTKCKFQLCSTLPLMSSVRLW